MRLSKIANISISETDSMDILEERELVNLLIKDINSEQDNINLDTLEMENEHKEDNNRVHGEQQTTLATGRNHKIW